MLIAHQTVTLIIKLNVHIEGMESSNPRQSNDGVNSGHCSPEPPWTPTGTWTEVAELEKQDFLSELGCAPPRRQTAAAERTCPVLVADPSVQAVPVEEMSAPQLSDLFSGVDLAEANRAFRGFSGLVALDAELAAAVLRQ